MFVDASAIVAILNEEADAAALSARIEKHKGPVYVSALARFEASTGLARAKGRAETRPTAEILRQAEVVVDAFAETIGAKDVEISREIGRLALEANRRFGRAVGHPADLNFGDCFAYACAKAMATGLLFKGDDFPRTDIG
jgi:ribonuclease VapC